MVLRRGFLHLNRIIRKWGNIQVNQQLSTIGMRISAHATISPRRKGCKFRNKSTGLVEYFIRLITTHPVLKDFQVLGVRFNVCYWYLVGTAGALAGTAVSYVGSSPAVGGAEASSRPG